jgi:hypothetical protein
MVPHGDRILQLCGTVTVTQLWNPVTMRNHEDGGVLRNVDNYSYMVQGLRKHL